MEDQKRFRAEKRYVEWCRQYLQPNYVNLIAEDCWALGGGVLHNGQLFGHPKARYSRIVFSIGGPFEDCISEIAGQRVLQISAARFGYNVIHAAWSWYESNKDNPIVLDNLPNLVRLRADGLPPHSVGMQLIA